MRFNAADDQSPCVADYFCKKLTIRECHSGVVVRFCHVPIYISLNKYLFDMYDIRK